LAAAVATGTLEWTPGPPRGEDLRGAACVLVTEPDTPEGRSALALARQAGVPVNVADRSDWSDFVAMGGFHRGPLEVAVHTTGASAALTRRLRERLERTVTPDYGRLAEVLAAWRPRVKTAIPDPAARRELWLEVVNDALLEAVERGVWTEEEVARAIAARMAAWRPS
jgi:siroheme synthase-like protein